MSIIIPANSAGGGFEVSNSLRFNTASTDYLTRAASAFGTATNRKKCTISFWCKRSTLTVQQAVMGVETTPAGGANEARLILRGDDTLELYDYQSGYKFRYITSRVFRDPSAWLHIVFSVDTTQGTASNRVKLYINGVQETSFATETDPDQDLDTFLNSGNYVQLGRQSTGNSYYGGYLSEYVFIDGTALAATDFGEFDEDSGIWKPKSVSSLSFGTNGFYLEFGNSGALGTDSSGAGNTFTPVNLAAIDQTTDTCTNNFCLLNPLSTLPAVTLSEGNLEFTYSGGDSATFSTFAVSSGKWYWEIKALGADDGGVQKWTPGVIGAENHMFYNDKDGGYAPTAYAWYLGNGNIYNNDSSISSAYGTANQNDIIGVALDMDNLKLYFSKNNTFLNSGDPTSGATGTGAISLSANYSPYIPHAGEGSGASINFAFNFGNPTFTGTDKTDGNSRGSFEYAPPSGYLSLCTSNLSEVLS